MEHINITFPENLKRELDREARRQRLKRSTMIQKAVRFYLQLKKERSTRYLLREGYQEMYGESKELLREFEKLDRESLKYVD